MAFSSPTSGSKQTLNEINVTPFVDVMLVLLIVFMISAPLLQSGITVDLPQGDKDMKQAEEALVVTIDAAGKHYLNDSYLQKEIVVEKIQAAVIARQDQTVYVRGDKAIPYGVVMDLIRQINEAGIQQVSLITIPVQKGD